MELLDEANTSAYGNPEPTKVTTVIERSVHVVSGHDLCDLKQPLEQTEGRESIYILMVKCYQPMVTLS